MAWILATDRCGHWWPWWLKISFCKRIFSRPPFLSLIVFLVTIRWDHDITAVTHVSLATKKIHPSSFRLSLMFFIFTLYSLWLMYKSLDSLYIHFSFFIHLSCVLEVLFELFVAKDLLQLFGSKPYRLFEALGLDGQTSLSLPNVVSVLSIRMEFRRHGWRLRKLIPGGKKSDIPWENPVRVAMVEKSLAIWGHLRFVLCTFGSLVKEDQRRSWGNRKRDFEESSKRKPKYIWRITKNKMMGGNSIYSRMVASATAYIHYVNISIRYIWYMNIMYVYMYVICIHKHYIHLHIISTWGFRISAYVAVGNNPVLQPDVVGHPEIFMSLGPMRDVTWRTQHG